MEQQYGVRPKTLQGGAKDMKEVNDWVSQETSNNVQRFLAKPLPRNSFIHTVSAAHFKGGQPCWRNPGGWGGGGGLVFLSPLTSASPEQGSGRLASALMTR